jgi:hypothetical protein
MMNVAIRRKPRSSKSTRAKEAPNPQMTPFSRADLAASAEFFSHVVARSEWRNARSIEVLRDQINAAAPGRNKSSDGTIGDLSHQSRSSDHNPWVRDGNIGVVTAIDITQDPAHGCDASVITVALLRSKDARIKYIIWNRRISSSYAVNGKPAWTWRQYTGSNGHTKHFHLSVLPDKSKYDDTSPWTIR